MTFHERLPKVLGAFVTVFVAGALVASGAPAPRAARKSPAKLTLQRIFGNPMHPLDGRVPRGSWRPGHEAVVFTEPVLPPGGKKEVKKPGMPSFDLVQVDATTGVRSVLLRSTALEITGPKGKTHHPMLARADFAPGGDRLLIPDGDDLYLYSLSTKKLVKLATGPGSEEIPKFSPDGKRLAYVRGNDLYVYDIAAKREIRLTSDGSPTIRNGILDWVYEEELASRTANAFAWSKDGQRIAWLRLDDSPIPPYTIVDYLHTHSKAKIQYYPKAGDPSPIPSLHIVQFGPDGQVASRRSVTFADPIPYVPRFGFLPKDTGFWYQVLNRKEDRLTLMKLDFASGAASPLLVETDPYWIEPVDMLHFFPDGRFLWASRRSGYMHLEIHTPSTNEVKDLTPGRWDVTSVLGVDDASGRIWYQAARPTPMERRLYLVEAKSGKTTALTREPGTHTGWLSPAKAHLLVMSSTVTRTPHLELYAATGKHLRTLFANRPKELAAIKLGHIRFLQVRANDGTLLNADMITPPNFNPRHRYPVVVYVYGGPDAQVVRNGWGRSMELFHLWLAQEGFIVFSLDNRGSFGRSRAFEGFIKHRLGSSQLPDQLAGVRWLKAQRYVDPHRIGIWGWSYGGYFTTYALTHAPGVFAAGVAVAPVTDWKLYDTIYTERYMGKPSENPKGYEAGSVLAKVADLRDPLLIIHGTGDDNVHFQNTLQFANAAWRSGRTFSLKLFPNLKHGLRAKGSYLQVFSAIGNFFEKHLE
ncbi:MAG: prolyl oligopeptidase family serine peptidase [Acidobacteria bacterium]|nr:prolyl oligopeptidase family serine peptidase [Acidobacteriota bacterium]